MLHPVVGRGGIWSLASLVAIAAMRIQIDPSAIRQTRWYQYAARFLFGGLITAVAGLIAKNYGPGIGGLFLAFPAIFPASATLIEKHERQKKEKLGLHGTERARKAASVDAAGAAIGSIGLLTFAWSVSRLLPNNAPWPVLLTASLAWLVVSLGAWQIRKRL